MGKVHLVVEGSQVGTLSAALPSGGVQVTKQTSEGDSARMLAWMASQYQWVDQNGDPFTPTAQQIIEKWWEGITQGVINNVQKFEQDQAAQTAASAVQKISVS